jgi:calcium permeable stress-gated cation channel
MSLRLFATMLFFSAAVLWPIHRAFDTYPDPTHQTPPKNSTISGSFVLGYQALTEQPYLTLNGKDKSHEKGWSYLWSYLVFTWFFSALTLYFMNTETFKVVKIRQDYLGTQSTITDRTFRLTCIPKDIRTEKKIKEFIENLEIGHVQSVNLCREWGELDALMAQRQKILQKLEEAWSAYRSQKALISRVANTANTTNEETEREDDHERHDGQDGRLLGGDSIQNVATERLRPKIRLRFGFLKMRNRKIEYDTRSFTSFLHCIIPPIASIKVVNRLFNTDIPVTDLKTLQCTRLL